MSWRSITIQNRWKLRKVSILEPEIRSPKNLLGITLKRLAVHCNYGEFLDRALRDRFVCGLSNSKIQNKLLNTEDLTFEKACRIAKAMEMAERNTQAFHPTISESPQVNQLTAQDNKNTNHEQCFRCGGNNHSGQSCKFKSAKCYRCSKIGHLASVCRSKSERKKGSVHNLHVSESSDDELGIYSLYSLDTNRPSLGSYSVEMLINGKPCKMEVDTAADYSIMAHSVYLEKFADTPLTPSKVVLRTYTGEVLEVSGEMQCNVIYKDKHYSLPVVVVNYSGKPTLLNKNWLRQIKLVWGEFFSVSNENPISAEGQLSNLL